MSAKLEIDFKPLIAVESHGDWTLGRLLRFLLKYGVILRVSKLSRKELPRFLAAMGCREVYRATIRSEKSTQYYYIAMDGPSTGVYTPYEIRTLKPRELHCEIYRRADLIRAQWDPDTKRSRRAGALGDFFSDKYTDDVKTAVEDNPSIWPEYLEPPERLTRTA